MAGEVEALRVAAAPQEAFDPPAQLVGVVEGGDVVAEVTPGKLGRIVRSAARLRAVVEDDALGVQHEQAERQLCCVKRGAHHVNLPRDQTARRARKASCARSRRVAERPSSPGRLTSIRTRSGRSRSTAATAFSPSAASTTRQPFDSRKVLNRKRESSWSSATTTVGWLLWRDVSVMEELLTPPIAFVEGRQ